MKTQQLISGTQVSEAMKIIDERKYRRPVRIDLAGYLDTMGAWQRKADQDQRHE